MDIYFEYVCGLDIRFVECLTYASTDTPQQQEPGADPGFLKRGGT